MSTIPSSWCEIGPDGKPDPTRCNPIKRYRTYSYQHVILVSNDTGIAEAIRTESSVNFYNHPDVSSGKKRFDIQYSKNGIPFVVLINSMTDVQFSIGKYTLSNAIVGGQELQEQHNIPPSTAYYDATLTIDEPYGANFLEVISDIISPKKLNMPMTNLIFVVKTFFVGTLPNGSIEQFGFIDPILLQIRGITSNFGAFGSNYFVSAVPLTNGMANDPVLSTVGGLTIKTPPTIRQALNSYATAINNNLMKVAQVANPPRVPDAYYLTVDDVYANMVIDNVNNSNRDMDPKGQVILASEQGASIPSLMESISKLCSGVLELAKPDPSGNFILPYITSTVAIKDNRRFITFNLGSRRWHTLPSLPNVNCADSNPDQLSKRASIINAMIADSVAKNEFVQYDYIFSGNNTDITSLEMMLDWGTIASLNIRDEAKPISQASQVNKPVPPTNTITQTPTSYGNCRSDFSMSTTNNVSTTAPNAAAYLSFRAQFNKLVQTQSASCKLEIVGNPLFLGNTTIVDPVTNQVTSVGMPDTVKINVYMPQVNPETGQPDPTTLVTASNGFRSPFWGDGLFHIVTMIHTFDGGVFSQSMELVQLPVDDSIVTTSTTDNNVSGSSTGDGNKRPSSEPMASGAAKTTKKGHCNVPKQVPDVSIQLRVKSNPDFYGSLRTIEGGNSYSADNGLYWGAYQVGATALTDAGYMKQVSSNTPGSILWSRRYYSWTGVDGVNSLQQFKTNHTAQDNAIIAYHKRIWNSYLKDYHHYVGTTIRGILITQSGMIAASHLVGFGNVRTFLKTNGKTVYMDGNCIPLTNYMECMGGKDVSAVTGQPTLLASSSTIGRFVFTTDVTTLLA